jgi:hypothetical protein
LLPIADGDNLGAMQTALGLPPSSARLRGTAVLLPILGLCLGLCTTSCASPSFVPDKRERLPPASAREGSPEDVFMRAPWERWRVPNGTGRYHRGTGLLLRDGYEAFRVSDVSVYAADGSDVRVGYGSVDLGSGSQARVSISVFV